MIVVLGAIVPIRSHEINTVNAQAVWNRNELFVFVFQNKIAWSQNLWLFVWRAAKLVLGLVPPPAFHRTDCIVYHVTNTTVEENVAKDLYTGVFAPYQGSLYVFAGEGPERGGVFRCIRSTLTRIPDTEAAAIRRSFTYVDELFKREGWS